MLDQMESFEICLLSLDMIPLDLSQLECPLLHEGDVRVHLVPRSLGSPRGDHRGEAEGQVDFLLRLKLATSW